LKEKKKKGKQGQLRPPSGSKKGGGKKVPDSPPEAGGENGCSNFKDRGEGKRFGRGKTQQSKIGERRKQSSLISSTGRREKEKEQGVSRRVLRKGGWGNGLFSYILKGGKRGSFATVSW